MITHEGAIEGLFFVAMHWSTSSKRTPQQPPMLPTEAIAIAAAGAVEGTVAAVTVAAAVAAAGDLVHHPA